MIKFIEFHLRHDEHGLIICFFCLVWLEMSLQKFLQWVYATSINSYSELNKSRKDGVYQGNKNGLILQKYSCFFRDLLNWKSVFTIYWDCEILVRSLETWVEMNEICMLEN